MLLDLQDHLELWSLSCWPARNTRLREALQSISSRRLPATRHKGLLPAGDATEPAPWVPANSSRPSRAIWGGCDLEPPRAQQHQGHTSLAPAPQHAATQPVCWKAGCSERQPQPQGCHKERNAFLGKIQTSPAALGSATVSRGQAQPRATQVTSVQWRTLHGWC